MEYTFSKYLDNNTEMLKKIVKALSKSFKYASVLGVDIQGESYVVTDKYSRVEENKATERGFVFRVYSDGLYSEYSTNVITSEKEIVNKIIEASNVNGFIDKAIYLKPSKKELFAEGHEKESFERFENDEMDCQAVIKGCKKTIDDTMEDNEYIISSKYEVNSYLVSKIFISSKKELKQAYNFATSKFTIVLNKDSSNREIYVNSNAQSVALLLKKNNQKIRTLSETAINLLDSTYPIAGDYDCVLSPSLAGELAKCTFGYSLENDYFTTNRSKLKLLTKEKICSYLVSMKEDTANYFFFDDEGTLSSNHTLMENGVLTEGYNDIISATMLANKKSGNGIRSSYKNKAYSRSVSPYFESGKENVEDIIKSISYGFLIESNTNSHSDIKDLSLSINALVGREIVDGKLTGKIVSPLIIEGNSLDIVSSISKVSKNPDFSYFEINNKNGSNEINTFAGGPYLKVKVRLG